MIYFSVNHSGYCEVIKDGLKYSKLASFLELYGRTGFLFRSLLRILLGRCVCPNATVVGFSLELWFCIFLWNLMFNQAVFCMHPYL